MSNIVGTFPAEKIPAGYRQLAVSSSVVTLEDADGGIPKHATRALIIIEDDDIRCTNDGTTPTASVGMIYGPNASQSRLELVSREEIEAFQAIRVATDAELNISYYHS